MKVFQYLAAISLVVAIVSGMECSLEAVIECIDSLITGLANVPDHNNPAYDCPIVIDYDECLNGLTNCDSGTQDDIDQSRESNKQFIDLCNKGTAVSKPAFFLIPLVLLIGVF